MYTMIRRYTITPKGGLRTLSDDLRDTLLPTLRALPGFVSYQFVIGEADGGEIAASVSTFNTAAEAQESARVSAEWVKTHSAGYTLSAPQISLGEVTINTATGAAASSYSS
jgi:hypothetical protein